MTLKGTSVGLEQASSRAVLMKRLRATDTAFRILTRSAALAVLALLSATILSLVIGSAPAFQAFGFSFVTTEVWNPVTEQFGALAPIYGTLVTSFIAMLIAVPVGVMIAFFLTELCPKILRRPIAIAIELLAGIPSIIYGIWGLFVFAPFLQSYVQPFLIDTFGNVPILSSVFEGPPYGIGTLTAGFILAIMVLPFITAISRDVFDSVPPVLKEAAYGLGCTTWEVFKHVVMPYTRVGVIGGVMLALNIDVVVPFIERLFNVRFLDKSVYYITDLPSQVQRGDVITIAVIALGLALVATLYPAWKAARVNPAEALRYE